MKETKFPTRFEIDDDGYKKLNEEFTPTEIIYELISNAFDLDYIKNLKVTIKADGDNRTLVIVEDDGEGYERLVDIFKTYGESIRKGDKSKTGWYDEGQKKAGSVAIWFIVKSKNFQVEFPEDGGRVEIGVNEISKLPKDFRLTSGMTASADLLIGKRTIMSYLSRPFTKGFSKAFSEPD